MGEKSEVNRLFLDASLKSLTVVLDAKGKVSSAFEGKPKATLERMFPLIESLCRKACIAYRDLDEIYATTGPGSSSGIRMVLAQARVFFAFKREVNLYAAPTTEVLFRASGLASGLSILSDRRDSLFYALYENGILASAGHASRLEEVEGGKSETVLYASSDEGAEKLSLGRKAIAIPVEKALLSKDAYRRYTPDEVGALLPLYPEKL